MFKTLLLMLGSIAGLMCLVLMSGLYIVPAALISRELIASVHEPSGAVSAENDDLRIIQESASLEDAEGSFWLNSGGWIEVHDDTIETIHDELPSISYWRIRYRVTNPTDTDNGYHPQNLLRLVTTTVFTDSRQEVFARIEGVNSSDSANRNESNGILLMSRYVDGDNLYYAGIRVDGYAVIKEKRNGVYETLALVPLFGSPEQPYDKEDSPNLIPEDTWIGLRLTTQGRANGGTNLTLEVKHADAPWETVASAHDDTPLAPHSATHGGLRSDFMDVTFRGYRIDAL